MLDEYEKRLTLLMSNTGNTVWAYSKTIFSYALASYLKLYPIPIPKIKHNLYILGSKAKVKITEESDAGKLLVL